MKNLLPALMKLVGRVDWRWALSVARTAGSLWLQRVVTCWTSGGHQMVKWTRIEIEGKGPFDLYLCARCAKFQARPATVQTTEPVNTVGYSDPAE